MMTRKMATKKPTKQKGLSKRGINRLEKIMLANGKYFYNQHMWAKEHFDKKEHACGTELCAGGFCHLIKVGEEQFQKEAKSYIHSFSSVFEARCSRDGKEVLGIKTQGWPQVFSSPSHWPRDLENGYYKLKTPMARVRFYIRMLRTRANEDGTLREKA